MTHQLGNGGSKGSRSQSTSRSHGTGQSMKDQRRKSVAHVGDRSSARSSLKVDEQSIEFSKRRYSTIKLQSSPKFGGSPSCRSRSLKSQGQECRQGTQSPNTEQSSAARNFNYSLSVPGDETEFHRLRNFTITSKGIVNRGDSFRCKSSSTSRSSSPRTPPIQEEFLSPDFVPSTTENDSSPGTTTQEAEEVSSAAGTAASSSAETPVRKYSVWIMGSVGVGKSSLKLQFMTSEYICENDAWKDDNNKNVIVVIDGDEVELELGEYTGCDDKALIDAPLPDAFLVVYSVTNRRSYVQAKKILSQVERLSESKAVILVGNKTDLARLRTVSTVEGRSLAKEWGVKFIETSVAINHQVDELLVGVVTQIRLRSLLNEKHKKKEEAKGFSNIPASRRKNKASGIIIRLWRKTCMTNKSCDNLHSV